MADEHDKKLNLGLGITISVRIVTKALLPPVACVGIVTHYQRYCKISPKPLCGNSSAAGNLKPKPNVISMRNRPCPKLVLRLTLGFLAKFTLTEYWVYWMFNCGRP